MSNQAALANRLKECENEVSSIDQQIRSLRQRKHGIREEMTLIETQLASIGNTNDEESQNDGNRFLESNFAWSSKLQQLLESVFSLKEFRSHQLATINATLSGRDVLLVMPTGGGKSLCFQLAALVTKGMTLVVSPLISLMEDQLNGLNELGIKSAILNSQTSKEDSWEILKSLERKTIDYKMLYVTPEKLAKSKRIMVQLEKCYKNNNLDRLVIDEAHCCSQWGHDFRTDYQFLGIMRNHFANTPILCLTATATSQVIIDIQEILNIRGCFVFKDSFNRPNLKYTVNNVGDVKKEELVEMIAIELTTRFKSQSGLIYCLTVREVDDLVEKLCAYSIRARAYHAQLSDEQRKKAYHEWYENRCQVVVATIAFGMGINKADVRFVIHASMSKSVENYYQETGRAGRDGRPAECILYFRFADVFRATTLSFSEKQGLKKVYNMANFCVDVHCRKRFITRYFSDETENVCSRSCDNCAVSKTSTTHVSMDIGEDAKELIQIIEFVKREEDRRLTAPKLVDIWFGKGEKKLRPTTLRVCKYKREYAQNIVCILLFHEYLKEEFHFTPYSTISYVGIGSRWMIRNEKVPIPCCLCVPKGTSVGGSSKQMLALCPDKDSIAFDSNKRLKCE